MSAAGDLLRRAKARIATPERWAKGTFARDADGCDLGYPGVKYADSCLCVDAALLAIAGNEQLPLWTSSLLGRAARARGFETASKLNDAPATTHADVMDLFDAAIAWAEADA